MGHEGDERGEHPADTSDVLDEARRRYLMYCLHLYSNPVRLSDIAYQITIWEGAATADDLARERHRTYMSLYHDHLPTLEEAGLVEYDQREDIVEVGPAGERLQDALEDRLAREIDDLLEAEHSTFGEETPAVLPDMLHRALAAPERRQLLSYLLEQPRTTLEEATDVLAGWLTEHEQMVDPGDHERIRTTLHHVHLPLLEEAGVITYDAEDEVIRLSSLSDPVQETVRSAARYHRTTRTDRWHHDGPTQ